MTEKPELEKLPRDLEDLGESLPERIRKSIRSTAKRMLPALVIQEVRQYQAYDKSERSIYLKTRVSDGLALRLSRPPKKARSFVFVCFGNIMRSPMCEALMNRAIGGSSDSIKVTSAGLNAIPGRPTHPWAIEAAREFGISLENHRARLLTSEMIDQADAIFAMDNQNRVQLLSRWARARNKVFMLSAYGGNQYPALEICDPYYLEQQETRRCYQILDCCIQNLAQSLLSKPQGIRREHNKHVAQP